MSAKIIPFSPVTLSAAETDEMQTRAALDYADAAERLSLFRPAAAKAGWHLSQDPYKAAIEPADHILKLARDLDIAEVAMGNWPLPPELVTQRRPRHRKPDPLPWRNGPRASPNGSSPPDGDAA